MRILLTVVLAGVLLGGGRMALGWPVYPGPIEPLIAWLILSIMVGFGLIAIWGGPAISWAADFFTSLYMPSDKNFRIRPEYSIAEARVAQGKWEEAIAAFRADIEKFPDESYPHTRIADIMHDRLHDREGAGVELKLALEKTKSQDSYCLVARRLIDLHLEASDRAGACALLREIQKRYPDTRHAKAAAEMLARIEGEEPPG